MKRNLAIVGVLVLVTAFVVKAGQGESPSRMNAMVPDAAAQRNEILSELKGLNERIDKLTELLASGRVSVEVKREAKEAK